MNIKTIVYVCFAAPLAALAASSVTSITVQQRYPWNGMMDITCNVTSGASLCRLSFSATANGESIPMQSVALEGGTVTNSTLSVAPGTRKFVWNAAADLPKGFSASNVKIGVVATDASAFDYTYLVINISGGANATSYPVTGLNAVPSQGWESYGAKTTKLVFRRCEPGTFMMLGIRPTTLTKPFYMGVYPLQEAQIKKITGWSSATQSESQTLMSYRAARGRRDYSSSYEGLMWPIRKEVYSNSIIGLLRTKTSLGTIDLPTEAQWEYACRAGTTTMYNDGSDKLEDVDTTKPNNWGMYGFHDKYKEWCLDFFNSISDSSVVDPVGPDGGYSTASITESLNSVGGRVVRGGATDSGQSSSQQYLHTSASSVIRDDNSTDSGSMYDYRIRLCITVE